ncbi:SPOR domain-containing protein [Viridibacterium curvum]|uniref:SPOR domain-containing protein n=1 Tax=Viridibacterium curvum TaxID=1101404 RepID=A0ABP9QZT5_9RHOO
MIGFRLLLGVLLAFNLACLAIAALPLLGRDPLFMGTTEPERMLNQLAPERLKVLHAQSDPLPDAPPPVAVASAEASSASQPEASTPAVEVSAPAASVAASAPQPAAAPLAASAPGGVACVAFGHMTVAQAQTFAQRVRKVGSGLSVREEAPKPSSFWVNIPPQGGKDGAERRAAELKEIGLEDFFIVQEVGENRFAISLGLFKAESLAERQLETLQKRGVKGAKVSARINPNGARVEISGSGELVERATGEAAAEVKAAQREACAG